MKPSAPSTTDSTLAPATSDGWAAWHWLRGLAVRFRAGWAALPRRARHGWLLTLTGGWVACGLLMAGLVVVVEPMAAPGGLLAGEAAWLETYLAALGVAPSTAVWMNVHGYAFFSVPIVCIATAAFARQGRPLWALSALASYFMVALVIVLGWTLWPRPRPDLVLNGALAPGFHSFPSGHVGQAIPVYGLLVYAWVRRSRRRIEQVTAWTLFAAVIGVLALGRMLLGAHWPSDIAAGTLVGSAWLATLILALRKAEDAQRVSPVNADAVSVARTPGRTG